MPETINNKIEEEREKERKKIKKEKKLLLIKRSRRIITRLIKGIIGLIFSLFVWIIILGLGIIGKILNKGIQTGRKFYGKFVEIGIVKKTIKLITKIWNYLLSFRIIRSIYEKIFSLLLDLYYKGHQFVRRKKK